MGLYNFQERFVFFILNGSKSHTIRAIRKNPDEPGDTMHLYTGLRHKGARLLGRPKCIKREDVIFYNTPLQIGIVVDGILLQGDEREALARRDGFPGGFAEMLEFWKERLETGRPWFGHIYHWEAKGFPGRPR